MQDWRSIGSFADVPAGGSFRIVNARVPADLAPALQSPQSANKIVDCEIIIHNGKIAFAGPAFDAPEASGLPVFDLRNGIVLPRFVEVHTHIDKSHIWPRIQNENGTTVGARVAIEGDRNRNWTPEDVRERMEFSLKCAYAHGTGALRTHIDSYGKQTNISFPVFSEVRQEWKDRIRLQAVALFPTQICVTDEEQFRQIADAVEKHDGIMGGVTAPGGFMAATVDLELDRVFGMAKARGFEIDFHVDETIDGSVRSIEHIADAAIRHKFGGRILLGHCCSLSYMPEDVFRRIALKLAEAGCSVVSLPMVNMYLQDRKDGRTPRFRGVAPLHELEDYGVKVMVSSDNTRDPYHAYGDLDMLEVFREATHILHFDYSDRPWMRQFGAAQAEQMGMVDLLQQLGLLEL